MDVIEARKAFYAGSPLERGHERHPFEVRTAEGGGLTLEGFASLFDTPYGVRDALGEYTEVITRTAFDRTLANGADVRLLVNHDGIPMARTKSGTLTLDAADAGLRSVASLDGESPLVRTVISAMNRGDLDQMSFAFSVPAGGQSWNEDYTERTITECKLFDVSVVTYPANPETSVKLRSRFDVLTAKLRDGRTLRSDDVDLLAEALDWYASSGEPKAAADAAPAVDDDRGVKLQTLKLAYLRGTARTFSN